MICGACGGDLVATDGPIEIEDGSGAFAVEGVDHYACERCGAVSFMLDQLEGYAEARSRIEIERPHTDGPAIEMDAAGVAADFMSEYAGVFAELPKRAPDEERAANPPE